MNTLSPKKPGAGSASTIIDLRLPANRGRLGPNGAWRVWPAQMAPEAAAIRHVAVDLIKGYGMGSVTMDIDARIGDPEMLDLARGRLHGPDGVSEATICLLEAVR